MNGIRRGLVTTGFLAAMFGGGAIGAVAFGATGGGSSSTTTTGPGITIAPSTGGTTTSPTTPSPSAPTAGQRPDCPEHGTQGSASGSTAAFF
ncbi:MAG TPA: hypothetical protein VGH35_03920 [Gaiellaceae bacterium]|jgi:hypothetical protein